MDRIRVSLTEDPEAEYQPCNRLAEIGGKRLEQEDLTAQQAVPAYTDAREFTSFARRTGRLPEQREGDGFDYRGLLNRDGSVLSAVSLDDLANPQTLHKRRTGVRSICWKASRVGERVSPWASRPRPSFLPCV